MRLKTEDETSSKEAKEVDCRRKGSERASGGSECAWLHPSLSSNKQAQYLPFNIHIRSYSGGYILRRIAALLYKRAGNITN